MNAPLGASASRAGSAGRVGPAASVRGLEKSYGGPRILDGVDFDVAHGAAVAIIGANGSGKSTLLRCMLRLTEASGGEVALLGSEVSRMRAADLRRFRARVGFVWQRHNLVPRLSALTNVIHGVQARMSGPRTWFQALAPAEVRAEAMACLARVGLADFALRRVDGLSGGQSQRVAIARMLMQRPESLDPQSGEEVMRLLSNLARESGLTLLVVSHRLEHTLAFSDRVIGLAGGRVALDLPTREADAGLLRGFFDAKS